MIENLKTLKDVAKELNCHKTTVFRAVKRAGVGRRIGNMIALTDVEIEATKAAIPGRVGGPNMKPGNELWKLRKKSPKSRK